MKEFILNNWVILYAVEWIFISLGVIVLIKKALGKND